MDDQKTRRLQQQQQPNREAIGTLGNKPNYSYFTKEMAIKEWNTRIRPKKEAQNG